MDRKSVVELNVKLKNSQPEEIIQWAVDEYGSDIGMTTSFGYTGVVLLYEILKINPDIEVFFIDTGFHFQQSLDFAKELSDKWNLNIHTVKPKLDKKDLIIKIGDPPYELNPDLCCQYNKVDPLMSFIYQKKAWFSGIRRDQAETRKNLEVLAIDKHGALKIHPFVYWTRDKVWSFIKKNNIPHNPLHDQHYTSVGCAPCTSPTKPGCHERDGRWPHSKKLECGINDFNSGNE